MGSLFLNTFFLAVFAMCGVFVRCLIEDALNNGGVVTGSILDSERGANIVYPNLLSNMVGSMLMGILHTMKQPLSTRISSSVYLGLTKGFCGCISSFSGWIIHASNIIVNGHGDTPAVNAILCLAVGLATSVSALRVGNHVRTLFTTMLKNSNNDKSNPEGEGRDDILKSVLFVLLVSLIILCVTFLAINFIFLFVFIYCERLSKNVGSALGLMLARADCFLRRKQKREDASDSGDFFFFFFIIVIIIYFLIF